jgi:hypothetical protein
MKHRVTVTALLTAGAFLGVGLLVLSVDAHPVRDVLPSALLAGITAAVLAWRWSGRHN